MKDFNVKNSIINKIRIGIALTIFTDNSKVVHLYVHIYTFDGGLSLASPYNYLCTFLWINHVKNPYRSVLYLPYLSEHVNHDLTWCPYLSRTATKGDKTLDFLRKNV